MDSKTYTLDELCLLTDFSKRTVRYYIQIGVVDRPVGETRAAHYQSSHLEQLLKVKKLTDAGISLERVKEAMTGEDLSVPLFKRKPGSVEVKSHLYVMPGVELQISPEEAGMSPEQVRALVKEVMRAAQKVINKDSE